MTRKADLETVRSAFRIAGLADGGIESFDDVGLELLWQIAEIRAQQERKPALICNTCGADRFIEDCKGVRSMCPLFGTTQTIKETP